MGLSAPKAPPQTDISSSDAQSRVRSDRFVMIEMK